jgi:hypothetical protein
MRKYASAARARADELLDLMDEGDIDAAAELLRGDETLDLAMFIGQLSEPVATVLEQTPAKDKAWKKKTERTLFLRQWLAARHWAIVSANALSLAEEVSDLQGLPYRVAGRAAAQAASRWMDPPSLSDLLSTRLL